MTGKRPRKKSPPVSDSQQAALATMATTVLMADAAKRVLMETYGWPEEQARQFVSALIEKAGAMGAAMREEVERKAAVEER